MDVANELRERGALDEEECFIDATFVMAKSGGAEIGATKRGKGWKSWRLWIATACRSRLAHTQRVQLCFDFYMIEAKPENLIGDRAYDSDPLDETLHQDGIEMIAPHRSNRSKPPTQDTPESILAALAGRALLRDTVATSHPRPLGVSSPKLPRFRPARLPYCPVQAILR
jgi:hypothetical protein